MTSRAAEKNLRYRAAGLTALIVLAALGFITSRQTSTANGLLAPAAQKGVQQRARSGAARVAKRKPRIDYRKFSHGSTKHQEQACDSCHKFPSPNWQAARKADAAFPDITGRPAHASCLNCHRKQFFARERPAPAICSVCHTNSTPRNTARHPFPNPPEAFNLTARARDFVSDFRIFFPHDKHIEIVSQVKPVPEAETGGIFIKASFRRARSGNMQQKDEQKKEKPKQEESKQEEPKQEEPKPNETSCAVCHQTYQPQGESEDEYATKPPEDLGEAFWLKKGTFKTTPNHASCFTCHSLESGVLPAPNDCAACHRLPAPVPLLLLLRPPRSDFNPKIAAAMSISDPLILQKWRRRTSGAFRHEWMSHAELSCNVCHNVAAMNTLDEATKQVPILSCGGCHVTPTTADGGALNLALDERKAKPDFQCTKCHLTLGKEPTPKSHVKAVERVKPAGGS